ncbi:hypothetical protein ATO13_17209 [Stappia sp. 22II-S9-Z10]|nr:hypothetical protein ATO13_17209 [Stappia sp. 22II-S9-Z10]
MNADQTIQEHDEFAEYEASLPDYRKRENRPALDNGYRLSNHDLDRVGRAVGIVMCEAFQRKSDKEAGLDIAPDAMEPPALEELIARACRQMRECDESRQRLDETSRLLIEVLHAQHFDEAGNPR